MNSAVPKYLYAVPVLYVILILFLLLLHLSAGSAFSFTVPGLSVSGELNSSKIGGGGLSITLETEEIQIAIDEETPIQLRTVDGTILTGTPVDFKRRDDGVSIFFEDGFSIEIISSLGGDRLSISLGDKNVDLQPSRVASVAIPFAMTEGIGVEQVGLLPLAILGGDAGKMLLLPKHSTLDPSGGVLHLSARKDGAGSIVVQPGSDGWIGALRSWVSLQDDWVTSEEYEQEVESFFATAKDIIMGVRLNERGISRAGGGDVEGSLGEVGNFLLSESLWEDDYGPVLALIGELEELSVELPSIESAPYTGDIVEKAAGYRSTQQLKLESALSYISDGDASLFSERDLFFLVTGLGSETALRSLSAYTEVLDPASVGLSEAVGMFTLFIECVESEGEPWQSISHFAEIPALHFLSALVVVEDNLFLLDGDSTVSVLLSLEVGELLIRSGEYFGEELHAQIGRELIRSALLMRDEFGYLPEHILIEDGQVQMAGSISPESIYGLFRSARGGAMAVSLAESLGAGRWIFYGADRMEVEKMGRDEYYSFSFPPNSTHHIVFGGVEPGFLVRMLGIVWNPDPNFQNYYTGWYYVEEERELYVKLRHSTERETIHITYDIPEPPAVEEDVEVESPVEPTPGEATPESEEESS